MSDFIGGLTALAFIFWLFAAWVTHIVFCFNAGTWGLLIGGAIFFPIAWFHGTWLWF